MLTPVRFATSSWISLDLLRAASLTALTPSNPTPTAAPTLSPSFTPCFTFCPILCSKLIYLHTAAMAERSAKFGMRFLCLSFANLNSPEHPSIGHTKYYGNLIGDSTLRGASPSICDGPQD
eukprot:COSAG05_NODE_304_length_11730_cov_494.101539_7_plen_121_part_00